ncbi:MAG: PAS domain-containing protein [Candidatus Thiodiazotropha sp. (ex Monitilora ramsayi)]|nr:PAS domain-containing protein [Candidatus Thiodiazotropha sp. (ex Monitilora ramsayi)]
MVEKWSLRFRVFLFFALISLMVPALLGSALWVAAGRIGPESVPHLVLWGGGAGFAIIGVVLWVWLKFDENVVAPINTLTNDLQTLIHANPEHGVETEPGKYLGLLAPTAREMAAALESARKRVGEEVEVATRKLDQQRARLESMLRDLNEGVLVCNLNHQILLYNRRALEILHYYGEIGLGRSLTSLLNTPSIAHGLENLTGQLEDPESADGFSAHVVCSTTDGRHIIEGQLSLILDADETEATGYVVTFDDATEKLSELGKRDRILRDAIEGLRAPVANLCAATEMLTDGVDMDDDGRKMFENILSAESSALSKRLEQLSEDYGKIITGHWPMSDVYSSTLLNCVVRRFESEDAIQCMINGDPVWLHCDSLSIVEMTERIIRRIAETTSAATFELEPIAKKDKVYIDIAWPGEVVRSGTIDSWLDESFDDCLKGMTGRDILENHKAVVWSEEREEGVARLRLPLPKAKGDHRKVSDKMPGMDPRPEFYDFDLLKNRDSESFDERALSELTYVVFDTETTGMEPSSGDEIIQLAGVRIVNGRIMSGEYFDQLVNPGRNIPLTSTKIHHITEEMVKNKPPISEVLPRFSDYVGDAVLVAHNAAFDMKFLELKRESCGIGFDNPVLDTVLLSAYIHDHSNQHTLDVLAERFGVEIEPQYRHTALGDSIATAEVFLRMIDLMVARGIHTFADAIEVSEKMVEIRRQQSRY